MSTAAIALVVCTKDRAQRLPDFLAQVRRLECVQPWELVLVDNGSVDDTSGVLRAFAASFPGRATVTREPRIGQSFARNRGWLATDAPIIAFTDDDCYPEPSYLNDVLTMFRDEELGFAGGRILLHDPSDAPVTIIESERESFLEAKRFAPPGFIQGANMAFRRQALVSIKGFDEGLGPGTPFVADDIDGVLRALAAGWKGKYDPRPTVRHHHRRKPGSAADSIMRSYDQGRGAYYLKCMLFLPQRWQCALYWLRCVRHQPLNRTRRELAAAGRYFIYQFRQRPNTAY